MFQSIPALFSFVTVLNLARHLQADVGRTLVELGIVNYKGRTAPHLQELLAGYAAAQTAAKKERRAIWRYGDASEDDTPVRFHCVVSACHV